MVPTMTTFPAMNFVLLIALVVIVVAGVLFIAYRTSRDTAGQMWQREAQAIRERANRLHDDLDTQLHVNREINDKLSRLEALPDLSRLMTALIEAEERSAERHTQLMAAIERILAR